MRSPHRGSTPFVARDHELAAIDRLLTAAESGSGSALELVGEPGIGKTRLLGELCARADAHKFLVLEGRAAEFERDLPFGLFVDTLDDYLGSLHPRRLDRVGREGLRELAAVFPSLADLAPEGPGGIQAERYRAYRAVGRVLELLAAERVVVLALDDVHWADAASIELLFHLLERPPRGPIVLVTALRPHQAPERLRAPPATRLRMELTPLSPDEADALLGDELAAEVRAELYEETGGNPFYLQQLARTRNVGASPTDDLPRQERSFEVPEAVQSSLRDELESLQEPTLRLAHAAAVAGETFSPELAGGIAELEAAASLTAIDELLDLDLVRQTDVPREFRFRHPIVRRAVYESAKPGWRLAAHGRAALLLAARGAPATARAHHIERSAEIGDEQAAAVLAEAAATAASRAPASAAHWDAAALRVLPRTGETRARRVELLSRLARTLASLGRLEEARAALDEALALFEDRPAPVTLIGLYADVEEMLGEIGGARSRLLSALEALPSHDDPDAIALKLRFALTALPDHDYAEMQRLASEALASARSLGHRAFEASALGISAFADLQLGRAESGERILGEAAVLADALDDHELEQALPGMIRLGIAETNTYRLLDAGRHVERVLAVTRAAGYGHLVMRLMLLHVYVLHGLGRLRQGAEVARAAVDACRLSGNMHDLCSALIAECLIATAKGDVSVALDAGEEAVEVARRGGDPADELAAQGRLAEARLAAGDFEGARDPFIVTAGGPGLPRLPLALRPQYYEMLTFAELGLGRVDAAREWAGRAEEATAAMASLPTDPFAAPRARAAALLHSGEAHRAADLAFEAVEMAKEMAAELEAVRARVIAGRALAALAERDRAISELERAAAEAAACGSARYRDEAALEMRRLGRRVPRGGRLPGVPTGTRTLSERERQVAELVAAGKKNREIAVALSLSEKTIETNLTKIFRKLGVSSRAAVGGVLAKVD